MVYRMTCVLVAASACVLSAAGQGRSGELLGGMEQWQFETALKQVSPAGVTEYAAHHASVAGTLEWSPDENMKFRATIGSLTNSLEEVGTGLDGADGGFYFQIGASLEADLASGGALLLDGSLSWGSLSWNDGADRELNSDRSSFLIGYIWGEGERARPYAGLAFNGYDLEDIDGPTTETYEQDKRFSVVVGARARTSTFMGLMELSVGGEMGVRAGLLFGF